MIKVDIVIVGAGIAGLWSANQLQARGLSVLVLENQAIGANQTIHSQGIIHGGIKYSLTGKLSTATKAIASMPSIWESCLAGSGVVDLTSAKVLSGHYLLWSADSLASKLGTVIASKFLQGKNRRLSPSAYPKVLHDRAFSGQVYQVDEKVLDIPSVLKALTLPLKNKIVKLANWKAVLNNQQVESLKIYSDSGASETVQAQKYIFTAGFGNQTISQQTGLAKMQARPLHMVYAKLNDCLPFYAHCVDMQQVPRVTITTHYTANGECVWYLGGKLAEVGIHQTTEQQCHCALQELKHLLPWLDMQAWKFNAFKIDRAEASQLKNHRPNYFTAVNNGNTIIAWPTKLAFAPGLAAQIHQYCATIKPRFTHDSLPWNMPEIAVPIWEKSC